MAEDLPDSDQKLSRQVLAVKVGAVVLGALILVVAIGLGASRASERNLETDLEAAMEGFLQDLAVYEGINAYEQPLVNHFDVLKLRSVSVDIIKDDIDPGYDFIIEIFDVSQYQEGYSFTMENETGFRTAAPEGFGNVITQERSAALIFGQETHAAVLRVTLMG